MLNIGKELWCRSKNRLFGHFSSRTNLAFKVSSLIVFSLLLISAINYAIFHLSYQALKDEIISQLKLTAANAALTLDPDKLKTIRNPEDEGSPTYLELQNQLQRFKAASFGKLRYVYTLAKSGDSFIYILDAAPIEDIDNHSPVGARFPIEEFPEASRGFIKPTAEKRPLLDREFDVISQSGYAPIKDKDGLVVGIVGVDMDVTTLKAVEAKLKNSIFLSVGISLLLILTLGLFLSNHLTRPIYDLIQAANKLANGQFDATVRICSRDELGQLGDNFNQMARDIKSSRDKLNEGNLLLSHQVLERTKELSKTTSQLQALLDNIGQGILTIGPDLTVNPQYSKVAEKFFHSSSLAGAYLPGLLLPEGKEKERSFLADWLRLAFKQTLIEWEDIEALQPIEEVQVISSGNKNRFIHFHFHTIHSSEDLTRNKLMVILKDTSENHQLEQKLEEKTDEYKDNLQRVIEIIQLDQDMFLEFIKESKENIQQMEPKLIELKNTPSNTDLLDELFRIIHTIKGNAGVFGLDRIAQKADQIESFFSVLQNKTITLNDDILDDLFIKIDEFSSTYTESINLYERVISSANLDTGKARTHVRDYNIFTVRTRDLDDLEHKIVLLEDLLAQNIVTSTKSAPFFEAKAFLGSLRQVRMDKLFSRLSRMTRDISLQLEKKVSLNLHGGNIEVDKSTYDKLGDPLIHLLRNALDHGIESPSERMKAGKPEEGQIELYVSKEDTDVVISLSDDGRGLDPETVKAVAIEKGFIYPNQAAGLSDEKAINLIFAAGFSTRNRITKFSGRGVGMDVVKNLVEDQLNGSIALKNNRGYGLKVIIRIPLDQTTNK